MVNKESTSNSNNNYATVISLAEVYGKSSFDTASEYRMGIALALECARRGILLDFTGMSYHAPLNSPYYAGILNYLISKGFILGVTEGVQTNSPFKGKDLSYLDTPNLLEFVEDSNNPLGGTLRWSTKYGKQVLGLNYHKVVAGGSLPYVFTEIACKHLLDLLLGLSTYPLNIYLDRLETSATNNFLNLASFLNSVPRFHELVKIHLDSSSSVDMSLSLFQYDAINSDFNKFFSVEEKLSILEQKGIREGMIVILFDRKGLNKSNSLGQIEMAHVVRVDEIIDGKLYLTHLRATRTREELTSEYDAIPDDHKHLYTDLLEPQDSVIYTSEIDLRDCGIGDHFLREKHIIDTISTVDFVDKLVSPNGGIGIKGDILGFAKSMRLNEADAIYYTLMQNNAPFNSKMFRDFYFNGGKGTWEALLEDSNEV